MISAILNISPSALNLASASSTVSASATSQETLLEAELAVYTQQLAETSSGDSSKTPGALSAQQLQEQIAAIQQQIDQLNAQVYTPISGTSSLAGSLINTFA